MVGRSSAGNVIGLAVVFGSLILIGVALLLRPESLQVVAIVVAAPLSLVLNHHFPKQARSE